MTRAEYLALAERVEKAAAPDFALGVEILRACGRNIGTFAHLWDTLHGEGAWDANPEVVAISFDLRKGNIDHGR